MIFFLLLAVFLKCLGINVKSRVFPLPNATSPGKPFLSVNMEILVPIFLCFPSHPVNLLKRKEVAVVVSIAPSERLVLLWKALGRWNGACRFFEVLWNSDNRYLESSRFLLFYSKLSRYTEPAVFRTVRLLLGLSSCLFSSDEALAAITDCHREAETAKAHRG